MPKKRAQTTRRQSHLSIRQLAAQIVARLSAGLGPFLSFVLLLALGGSWLISSAKTDVIAGAVAATVIAGLVVAFYARLRNVG